MSIPDGNQALLPRMRGWPLQAPTPVLIVLVAIVVAGAWLRLDDLAARQMGHTEIFTPGLWYEPWELSIPHPRVTVWQTLKGSLAEPHPPAWYLAMFSWTRLFGNDLFTLRLPSVLLGTAAIVVTYMIPAMHERRLQGLIAAAFVAFNGTLIFWSQIARPYIGASLLGLVATYLLLRLVSTDVRRPGLLLCAYLATILTGLLTNYYFWILFGTQVLWVVLRSAESPTLLLQLARAQLALLILASPTVCLAIYQAYRPSYLEEESTRILSTFFSFGFLHDQGWLATRPFPLPSVVYEIVLPAVAAVLWAVALATGDSTPLRQPADLRVVRGPSRTLLLALTVVALLCCTAAWYAGAAAILPDWIAPESRRVVKAIGVPVPILLAALALERYRDAVLALSRFVTRRPILHAILVSPAATLAVVPAAVVALISAVLMPFFAARHMIIFTPYVLIVLAGGACTLVSQRSRVAAGASIVALAILLIPAHWASVVFHHARLSSPRDYRGLAARWLPTLQESDLIFVTEEWRTTPIFYYVDGRRHHYVGAHYHDTLASHPNARVWLMGFEGLPSSDEARAAVAGYRRAQRLEAQEVTVELYVPQPADP